MARRPDTKWLAVPLQGLAYWMGLRDCYFSNYWLGESAIVAELCNLLAARAPSRQGRRMVVAPEHAVAYLEGKPLPKERGRRESVDLALGWRRKGRGGLTPQLCIDVKRLDGASYKPDLDRLARVRASKKKKPSWRGLVIVTSQGERPDEFMDKNGRALRAVQHTKDGTSYRVRRICKALNTRHANSKKGYWVVLLEVE